MHKKFARTFKQINKTKDSTIVNLSLRVVNFNAKSIGFRQLFLIIDCQLIAHLKRQTNCNKCTFLLTVKEREEVL